MKVLNIILVLFASICAISAQQCVSQGAQTVFSDPTCAQGGVGCNAFGVTNCRFCGFDVFPPCPAATTPTTTTTTSTTPRTTVTTGPTTPKTTTTRDPNAPTNPPYTGSFTYIPVTEPITNERGEKLIFNDEFDTFNLKTWKHDLTMSGGGNWEFQLYHNNRTNSYVKDGVLYIKPTLTEDRIGLANLKSNYRMDMWGGSPVDECTGNNFYGCERSSGAGGNILNPIQSAKITTVESFSFRYGRVEVRAKLPQGDWLWPAIWLLPRRNQYGMWPASGEIDIMESRGNLNYPHSAEGGADSFGSTLHWGADWTQNRFELTHEVYHHPGKLTDDFHVYGLYWSEERLYTYIDDESNIVLDIDLQAQDFWSKGKFPDVYNNPWQDAEINAPFNEEFYIIINLAVGGTAGFFPDGVAGKPWSDKSPNSVNQFYDAKAQWYPTWKDQASFEIDYVKVWSLPE